MLGDGGDAPTRYELLSMVKKHSKLLGKTLVDEQDASDVEMDAHFWHDVLDLYFIQARESRGHQDDDLIFFVRKMSLHGYGFNDNMEGVPPFFVRRWALKLDQVTGESSQHVDWRRSFYLNLIAHTSFTVTVAICSRQALQDYQAGQETPLSPIYKVVKTVYASPSRINFHLDARKEVETTPAYPDICFAVDDFDSTFGAVKWPTGKALFLSVNSFYAESSVAEGGRYLNFFTKVLTETDHCYCVLLNAHDGAAFPSKEEAHESSSSNISSSQIDVGLETTKSIKLTLFSGFVSYQMVREAYDAGRSRFGSLLSLGHSLDKADKLYMRGPGGRGEVEVAVSDVADQSQQELGLHYPVEIGRKGFGIGTGIGTIVRRAASVASVAAKHAYAAATAGRSSDEEILPLRCCLMSISLPWENIAYDLLFKGSPPVKM